MHDVQLVVKTHGVTGSDSWWADWVQPYYRELPYGYDVLAENLLDPSHLPFAHHGVLNRRSVPLLILYSKMPHLLEVVGLIRSGAVVWFIQFKIKKTRKCETQGR